MNIGNRRQIGVLYGDNWERVYSTTLTEATTSITISGLDGNTDEEYKLITRIVNGYNGSAYNYFRLNNDSTAGIVGYQQFQGENTDETAGRWTSENSIYLSGTQTTLNEIAMCEHLIYVKSGFPRCTLATIADRISGTTVIRIQKWGWVYNNTSDNITSLVIYSSQTNGLGSGTIIGLYKKRKKI
jgi:hypothetical protein